MTNQLRQSYQIVENPYYQTLNESPAVELVIENTEVRTTRKSGNNEQQKLASQMPRGTRIDDTGTRIQVKGGRNYTSRKLFISREEMFDDVVVRGLRADGLSTKLGVKNHKDGIAKLLRDLFHDDSRLPIIEEHFKTRRQKSNCAKTMFATMTHEELQFLKAETFPSRIDVQVRDYLTNTFMEQPQKLQATVEVLEQIQQIFKVLTPHTDFLSSHNFQTRGFFLDIILMTCSFLMQIIQDTDGNPNVSAKRTEVKDESSSEDVLVTNLQEKMGKENKTAAEILLSVGSDILDNTDVPARNMHLLQKRHAPKLEAGHSVNTLNVQMENEDAVSLDQRLPTTVVVEGSQKADTSSMEDDQWTTVEMVDGEGNAKYMLIKTDNMDTESFDTVKILEMLQNQGMNLDENMEIAFTNPNTTKTVRKGSSENNADNNASLSRKITLELDTGPENDVPKSSTQDNTMDNEESPGNVIIEVEEKHMEEVGVQMEQSTSIESTSDIVEIHETTEEIHKNTKEKRKDMIDDTNISSPMRELRKRAKKE